MKKLLYILLFCPFYLFSQNTIGGVKAIVPEVEVKRQSQFLVAEKERLLNNLDKALPLYKKFTYDHPEVDAGWYGLSRTYTGLKDLPNALDCIGKAVSIDPKNRWYSIYQADIYEKLGRLSEATSVYESLVKIFPETTEFYARLAYLYLKNEDPKRALKILNKWEDLVGVQEEIAFKKHVIYVGLGDLKRAAAEYQKLTDAYPDELKYRIELAEYYQHMGDELRAKAMYESVLERQPENPIARMALAGAKDASQEAKLNAMKPLFDDRMVPLDEKIRAIMPYFDQLGQNKNPNLEGTLLELGALLEKNHPDDAKTWSLSGDLFYHTGQSEKALERYQQCLKLNPTVFSVWDNTLTLLAIQKKYDEMAVTAEKAMDAFPNQPKAYFYYGVAANIKGRYRDARNQLEQGILMTVSHAGLYLDMLDQIGLSYLGEKDFDSAAARYQEALSKGGETHPSILEHMGDALSLQGLDARAVSFWKQAQQIRPSPQLEQKINAGKL